MNKPPNMPWQARTTFSVWERRQCRAKLRVGIGCKDGLNVSVAIATYLARQLSDRGLVASARHRELERLAKRAARAQAEVSGTQQGAVRSQGEGV